MATACKLFEEITVGATPVEYLITETNVALTKPMQDITLKCLSTNSGTIKFAVGETPPAANHACAAGEIFILQGVQNGLFNLWALGSGSGQVFVIC